MAPFKFCATARARGMLVGLSRTSSTINCACAHSPTRYCAVQEDEYKIIVAQLHLQLNAAQGQH